MSINVLSSIECRCRCLLFHTHRVTLSAALQPRDNACDTALPYADLVRWLHAMAPQRL